jgi:hypothetical protein
VLLDYQEEIEKLAEAVNNNWAQIRSQRTMGRVRMAYHFQTVPPLKHQKGTRLRKHYPNQAEKIIHHRGHEENNRVDSVH